MQSSRVKPCFSLPNANCPDAWCSYMLTTGEMTQAENRLEDRVGTAKSRRLLNASEVPEHYCPVPGGARESVRVARESDTRDSAAMPLKACDTGGPLNIP